MDTRTWTQKLFDQDDDDDEHKNMDINHDGSNNSHIDSGDLIVEILLRLPPNSVHRFRRVCKQWYSLISNIDFIQTHAITEHQSLVSISKLRSFKGRVDFVNVPYIDEEDRKLDPFFVSLEVFPTNLLRNYHLIDSSNGLLLFCDNNTIYVDLQNNDINISSTNYYVTNPITKCYFKLPTMIPIPNIKPEEKQALKRLNSPRHATLVFDPSMSTLSYKVIRYLIRGSRIYVNDLHLQIYVYSSETRSWSVLRSRIPDPMGTFKSGLKSVVLNGVLYWTYSMTKGDDLVCFDVEKECVWFLPLPPRPAPFYDRFRNCLYFGECGGRLRLIERIAGGHAAYGSNVNVFNCLPCSFDVMEREPQQQQQHQNSLHTWTVKYRVNFGMIFRYDNPPFVIHHCYKTKNRQGGSEEEEVLLLKRKLLLERKCDRNKIVSFSLTSNKFKNDELITIPESLESLDFCDFEDIFAYKPTLFPVS